MNKKQLKEIFNRTKGHCHFCGDFLFFEKYGCKDLNDLIGAWEADHIIQKDKGGLKSADNCLPACVRCNRLRWHRKGQDVRDLIFLGLIAKDEINKKSKTGEKLLILKEKRLMTNLRRRRK